MGFAERAELVARLSLDDRFSRSARGAVQGLNRMERGFGKIGTAAQKGLGSAYNNLKRIGVLAGTAVVGLGVGAVKLAADFEDAMTKSLAIIGDVSDELRTDMEKAAREVAKTSQFSATQAAEAYFFLASAGLSAETQLAAMPKVARFAAAGNFDLARATDLLTDAQSALGLTIRDDAVANMENMVRVGDILVKANTLANASVEQFSESLTNRAGAALKTLGKDVEEGVAVLAAFADQGVKGSVAGNALAIVLRDMQTASLKNKDAWKDLNVSIFDSEGEMRNMADIVSDLEGLLDGMSDKQKKLTLAQLGFADRSQSFLLTLLGSSEAIRNYEKGLREAAGTTESVAGKQLQSFAARWDILKHNIQDVGIVVGTELLPTLGELADEASTWLREHPGDIERFAEQVGEGFRKAVEFAKGIDWGGIANSLKVAAQFGQGLVQAFLAMPDWVKQAVITGWGLNKLTGGAIGTIGIELTKSAFRGSLLMRGTTPANPMFVADVTGGAGRGAGAAGGAAAAAGAGGIFRTLLRFAGVGLGAGLFVTGDAGKVQDGHLTDEGFLGGAQSVGGGALTGALIAGPIGALAGGLLGVVKSVAEVEGAINTEMGQKIHNDLTANLTQNQQTEETLRTQLAAVDEGIAKLQSNPLYVLVQGEALNELKSMREEIVGAIEADATNRAAAASATTEEGARLSRLAQKTGDPKTEDERRWREFPAKVASFIENAWKEFTPKEQRQQARQYAKQFGIDPKPIIAALDAREKEISGKTEEMTKAVEESKTVLASRMEQAKRAMEFVDAAVDQNRQQVQTSGGLIRSGLSAAQQAIVAAIQTIAIPVTVYPRVTVNATDVTDTVNTKTTYSGSQVRIPHQAIIDL